MNAHGVRYVVVGGHALAFHARPRFTKDIDVFVESSSGNAEHLLAALEDFGFSGAGLRVEDFTQPDRVVQLGYPPSRVDLMTSIDGLTFQQAWDGRVAGRFGDQQVFYLGRAELIRNKQASGRPQDLLDLEWLVPDDPENPSSS